MLLIINQKEENPMLFEIEIAANQDRLTLTLPEIEALYCGATLKLEAPELSIWVKSPESMEHLLLPEIFGVQDDSDARLGFCLKKNFLRNLITTSTKILRRKLGERELIVCAIK